jgi:hypothetical protein
MEAVYIIPAKDYEKLAAKAKGKTSEADIKEAVAKYKMRVIHGLKNMAQSDKFQYTFEQSGHMTSKFKLTQQSLEQIAGLLDAVENERGETTEVGK